MSIELKRLKEERAAIVEKMQYLIDTAEKEERTFNSQERSKWDHLNNQVKSYDTDIKEIERNSPFDNLDELTANEIGNLSALSNTRTSNHQSTWNDKNGNAIHVLPPEKRFSDHIPKERNYGDLTFGGYIRAMVLGAKTESEQRALSESTDSAGGFTVPEPLAAQIIDRLRAKSVIMRAGAQTVPMTSDTLSIARLASDPATGWHVENSLVPNSDPTFDNVTFTARTLISLVIASRELVEDSSNINDALSDAFANALALEVDRVALLGSGTAPEPRGIKNVAGIGSISMGTNGAAITSYDELLDSWQTLADSNSEVPTAAIMAPRTQTTYGKLKDTTNQPLRKPDMIQDLPMLTTTQIPINETQGTATNASSVLIGDFSDLMVGVRSSFRIEVLRERYADNFQYGFMAHLRADIQLAHAESFCEIIGITP